MNIFTNIRHANRFSATRLAGALALLGGAGLSGSATAAEPLILEVGERIDLRDSAGLELSGNWARALV